MPHWSGRIFGPANQPSSPYNPSLASRRRPSPDASIGPPPPPAFYGSGAYSGVSPNAGAARLHPSASKPANSSSQNGTFYGRDGGLRPGPPPAAGINRQNSANTSKLVVAEPFQKDWQPPGGRSARPGPEDRDLDTGFCATCNTRLKWPKGHNEYRCSVCQMINDLRPRPPRERQGHPEPQSGKEPELQVMPINLAKTRSILESCIDSYLDTCRSGPAYPASPHVRTPPHSPSHNIAFQNANDMLLSPGDQSHGVSPQLISTPPEDYFQELSFYPFSITGEPSSSSPGAASTPPVVTSMSEPHFSSKPPPGSTITRKPVATSSSTRTQQQPPRQPPPPPPFRDTGAASGAAEPAIVLPVRGAQQDNTGRSNEHVSPRLMGIPPRYIFKPLEDYIVRTIGNLDQLNTSFSRSQLESQPVPRYAEDAHAHRNKTAPRTVERPEQISELDAKTLLLGDVAENGLWWTGRDARSASISRDTKSQRRLAEHGSRRVSSKSPSIEWAELEEWYNIIMSAGTEWRQRLHGSGAAVTTKGNEGLLGARQDDIDRAFDEGRKHLRKVLLKASENILRRPGRPLKEASELRFLLILLSNPLLYPPSENHSWADRSATAGRQWSFNVNGVQDEAFGSMWDPADAYGIVKRILGLMANLNSECHRCLTMWFARLDEARFRGLVEVVQRFLLHRLKRQHGRKRSNIGNPADDLIPNLSGTAADTSAQLHAALGLGGQVKPPSEPKNQHASYLDDWQVRVAAKVMALLFAANKVFQGQRSAKTIATDARMSYPGSVSRHYIKNHGQLLSTTDFSISILDISDLKADFDLWESSPSKFAFCQYPFFLSVGAKIRLMEHDAKRQMDLRAREAFFDSILKNQNLQQYLLLKVRRDCLVEDSLTSISAAVGSASGDIKKGLKIQFVNEEGIDAGGLRKEWFLLLVREIFDPHHGMFLYDDESHFCYFNPHSFETSDQFFLVGALLGLAIYNSTMLDVPLPSFMFKKLLGSGSAFSTAMKTVHNVRPAQYTLDDLAEYKPALARGLRQLLEFNGDVQETFCRDFVAEIERYGSITEVPLCDGGARRPVTNSNRAEFVDLYIRFLLDTQVARQYEPFKRGFFNVCSGNALSLFQPEEIELLVRGSDEPLEVHSLRAVAVYENWRVRDRPVANPAEEVPLVKWFWELFDEADPGVQRRILSFITASDRIPATGAVSLVIKIAYAGPDYNRYPIARTCFNQLLLYGYRTKGELRDRLGRAMDESEGFGLR